MPATISTSETSSGPATVGADHFGGCGAVGGVADGEGARDGVGLLRDHLCVLPDGGRDGGAAAGLSSEKLDGLVFDQAEVNEFLEGFAGFCG